MIEHDNIYNMDCLEGLRQMEDATVDCCVTSPPYFALRDYGCEGQIGLEQSPEEYIARLCDVFREVMRVMKPEATCWVVIGDTYNYYRGATTRQYYDTKFAGESGHPARPSGFGLECKNLKNKDLIGIPWMLAFALRGMGFYLRQDIIWAKPNPIPESVKNRCTKSHEHVFLLTKQPRYYFSVDALREPANTGIRAQEYNHRKVKFTVSGQRNVLFRGSNQSDGFRNKRDVWPILVKPGYEGHHATFPVELPLQCIALGCPQGGLVLDPFMGTATTAVAAYRISRHYVGFELSPDYHAICLERLRQERQQQRLEFEEEEV